MRYGSVCSGIEAATVAWHGLGWRPVFFSEIEKFPRAVLAHHYPEVPVHGDFTTIKEGEYDSIDLLVGGTPCQDFSVAGLRAGLAGERGRLTIEFLELARRLRPKWVVWENVPGVLSADGGRAFGIFLGRLGQLGYGFAYRILDAQHCGVPQRRRRVFVVGHLGDWRRAAAVLFERESLSWNPPPRREAGQGSTYDVAPCIGASGRGFERSGDPRGQDPVVGMIPDVAWTLQERDAKGSDSSTKEGHLIPVAFTVKDYGQDAGGLAPTLRGGGFDESHANGGVMPAVAYNITPFDITQITSKDNRSKPQAGDPSHPLAAGAHAPAISFAMRGREGGALPEVSGDNVSALRAASGGSTRDMIAASAVRRLTPRECERLQGFPDDWTLIPYRRKLAADGPRYKALGNSMAVPVMRWIGERIATVEALP